MHEQGSAFVSLPTLTQVAQFSMDDILYDHLFIRVNDPSDTGLIDRIGTDLKLATN